MHTGHAVVKKWDGYRFGGGYTNNSEIAREVNLHRENLRTRRKRRAQRRIDALGDKPHSGRPPTYSPSGQPPRARARVYAAR